MTSRIDWVRGSCRLLLGIAEEFAATLPFSGLTIGTGIHLEPKTVALLLTLKAGGAGVVSTALVVASSCRIRSSNRRELLMVRAKKTTEAPTDRLDAMLARLQLPGIRDQLDSH